MKMLYLAIPMAALIAMPASAKQEKLHGFDVYTQIIQARNVDPEDLKAVKEAKADYEDALDDADADGWRDTPAGAYGDDVEIPEAKAQGVAYEDGLEIEGLKAELETVTKDRDGLAKRIADIEGDGGDTAEEVFAQADSRMSDLEKDLEASKAEIAALKKAAKDAGADNVGKDNTGGKSKPEAKTTKA
mgnify:CR=1 FL=1